MKLTTFILIISLVQVSAATLAQHITLNYKNTPLKTVLKDIRSQSGYDIVSDGNNLGNPKITITLNNADIDQAMKATLDGLNLSYTINDKIISIKKTPPTLIDKVKAVSETIDVHGRVVDETGKPLPGVTVKVKDGSQATITNANGEFDLKKVSDNTILVLTFVGYSAKEVPIRGDLNNIRMDLSNSKLDEVQVIAYGQTSKRLTTGNITTLKAEAIEKQPVSNPLLALQGRIPGLSVIQANGISGSGVTVRIQGQNSIGFGNDPFYVIDGVPFASQTLPTVQVGGVGILGNSGTYGSGVAAGGSGNPLSYINPGDIESISILKGADATSIYGSRAANGAILISTKKGNVGETSVDVNLQQGIGQVARKLDLLNTQQYLNMRREGLKNDQLTASSTDYDINGIWDATRYTDWQKVLIGNTAHYSNFSGTVRGGTNNVQYLVSGNYHRETSVFPGDFDDEKASIHFNLNTNSTNKRFKFNLSGTYLADNNKLPGSDLTGYSFTLAPDAPALYKPDGTLNWQLNSAGTSTWINPLSYTLQQYTNKGNNLLTNAIVSYELSRNLTFKTNIGYTHLQINETSGFPITAFAPERRLTANRSAQYSYNNTSSWIIEPQVTYRKVIGPGSLDALAGMTIQQNSGDGVYLRGAGYYSDAVLKDIRSATTVSVLNSTNSVYKYNALFGRINYNINDKYIWNLSTRRDGSSRFGSGNQFHNFASAGFAWVFSQENFFKNAISFVSFGKMRASYGTTGNDQIGDYTYLSLYRSYTPGVAYQGSSSLTKAGLTNTDLHWEETRKVEVGLDMGFLKDRITFSANYTRNRSSNQLLDYPLPLTTGYYSITQNFGATVQNTTLEFLVNSRNISSKSFTWSTSLNLTIPKNKVLSFPGLETSSYASTLIVGQPLTARKVFRYAGVDAQTGLYQFYTKDEKLTTTPDYSADMYAIANLQQKFYGGLENTFRIKGFELSFLFQFVKQTGFDNFKFGINNVPGAKLRNQPVTVLNRWQNVGDNVTIGRFGTDGEVLDNYGYLYSSTASYSDNPSFVRLKNLSFSYTLSRNFLERIKIKELRFYVQGQNLLTFTKYNGLDPETQNLGGVPLLKVFTAGVKATF